MISNGELVRRLPLIEFGEVSYVLVRRSRGSEEGAVASPHVTSRYFYEQRSAAPDEPVVRNNTVAFEIV